MGKRNGKIRTAAAAATATVALAAPLALARAEEPPAASATTSAEEAAVTTLPTSTTEAPTTNLPGGEPGSTETDSAESTPAPDTTSPSSKDTAPFQHGATLTAPSTESLSGNPGANGGLSADKHRKRPAIPPASEPPTVGEEAGALPAPNPAEALMIPSLPASTCAATGVPPLLIPIYQRAAAAYGLGPQGPAVLAGINEVETAFGTNLGPSSAGAEGWMQFMPSTWETYGVDADGDGVADPNNPEDAIFAAASYLSAAGMPADTYGAIFAYNHADWYVEEVLANAGCYAAEVGDPAFTAGGLTPRIPVFKCTPAPSWKDEIPAAYLNAFEQAAGRYELGKRGVWALAAVARLESNFGKGMTKRQLRAEGPLGLEPSEWREYAVDGDEDGHIRHGDVADSAATLARLIWSRGGLSAGLFAHNQAEWFVQEVLEEAEAMEGGCQTTYVDWRVAPLATFQTPGAQAVIAEGLASSPSGAPPAVKAAIAAANSIATTPYVWGGGHGSWYSYGYDCSGAVSFALYGAGLLDTPLTSGALESYGEPGPGKWITIYANAVHTYAVIAGLRWDTVGDAQGTGPRWHDAPPYSDAEGFVVRHPAGY